MGRARKNKPAKLLGVPLIAVTGGVATGKSTLLHALASEFPGAALFSADQEVARLLAEDSEVKRDLETLQLLWKETLFTDEGGVDRARLRQRVFADPKARSDLEAILHPRVRKAWESMAQHFQKNQDWMFAEIPLLYETMGEGLCHRVVVAACSSETQRSRLVHIRGLSESLFEQIRDAQMSLSEKCARADHVIWNDFSLLCLQRQTRSLARWLHHYYRDPSS